MTETLFHISKNNMKCLVVQKPQATSFSVACFVKVGSRHENKQTEHGLSHVLEHLLFKRTKHYKDVLKTIEHMGALYNAYTTYDHTCYYFKVNAEMKHIKTTLSVRSDMRQYPSMTKKDVATELQVVMSELRKNKDNKDAVLEETSQHVKYPSSHPLRKNIGGYEQNIAAYTQGDAIRHFKNHYVPSNCFLVCCGPVSPKKIKPLLTKMFNTTDAGRRQQQIHAHVLKPVLQRKPSTLIKSSRFHQCHVNVYVRIPKSNLYDLPTVHILPLIVHVFGEGQESRLFRELRRKHGLVYSIKTYPEYTEDNMFIRITTTCSFSKLFWSDSEQKKKYATIGLILKT